MARAFFKKKDFIIIIALLVVSISTFYFFYTNKSESVMASIYVDNQIYKIIDLSQKKETLILIENKPDVQIKTTVNGEIAFVKSDCPDKICIHTGAIKRSGQSAACLPNGVVIILNSKEDGLDGAV